MATAYTASNTLPLNALPNVNGVLQNFKATVANSGSATYAPDGLAAAPIFGPGGQSLQGNEIVSNGIVTLTSYIGPLLNSGALCWILSDCAGGELQVATATQSQHAAQFSQLTGVVGSVRNAKMSITAAAASGTFTADEIIVANALGGLQYRLGNFSKTINLATTGAGGMDTGTVPASGYVALYAIYNPTTATASILATNATSVAAGNVYGGSTMPSGYTASALLSVWPTTAAGLFAIGIQNDRKFSGVVTTVFSSSTSQASLAAISISGFAPLNAKWVSGGFQYTTTIPSNLSMNVASTASSIGMASGAGVTTASGQPLQSTFALDLVTPQTIYYSSSTSGGTPTYIISLSSYLI